MDPENDNTYIYHTLLLDEREYNIYSTKDPRDTTEDDRCCGGLDCAIL